MAVLNLEDEGKPNLDLAKEKLKIEKKAMFLVLTCLRMVTRGINVSR